MKINGVPHVSANPVNFQGKSVSAKGVANRQESSLNTAKNATINVSKGKTSSASGRMTGKNVIFTKDGDSCKIRSNGQILLNNADMKNRNIDQSIIDTLGTFRTREEEAQYIEQKFNDMITHGNSFRLIGSDGKEIQTITMYLNGDVNAKGENGLNASMSDLTQRKFDDVLGTGENGFPITYGMLVARNGLAAKNAVNNHYSKYINLSGEKLMKLASDVAYKGMSDADKYTAIIKKEIAGIELTSLSDADKYSAIHSKYAQLFGADFLKAGSIDYYTSNTDHTYKTILEQFDKDITAAIGSSEKALDAARSALYGDMSESDVRAAIAAKYPSGDEMTLRDLCDMTGEMKQVGVDGGMRDVVENATNFFDHIKLPMGVMVSQDSYTLMRESLLDQKLDAGYLSNAYNGMLGADKVTSETGQILQEHLGVALDSNGNASPTEPDSTSWFQSVVNWLLNDEVVSNNCQGLTNWVAQPV